MARAPSGVPPRVRTVGSASFASQLGQLGGELGQSQRLSAATIARIAGTSAAGSPPASEAQRSSTLGPRSGAKVRHTKRSARVASVREGPGSPSA